MKSILFGSDNSSPDTALVTYNRINAVILSSWSTNQSFRSIVVPEAMTLTNYYLKTDIAPGLGTSYTFTVMKNGSPTALEIVIADTATVGTDNTHSATFAAGDTVSLRSTPANTPATLSVESWNLLTQTNTQSAPVLSGPGSQSTTVTNYASLTGGHASGSGWSATESDTQIIVPTSGTLSTLYATASTGPGSGKSWQYTLMLNGSATALQATISNAGTTANDTVNSVSVAAGDTITMRSVPTGTPAASTPSFSMVFSPTVDGESFFGFGHQTAPIAGTSYEQPLGVGNFAWTASESNRPMTFGPYTITKMYAKLNTAPGVGTSRTFTLRKAAASSSLAVTISDANTTGNSTSTVNFAQGDQITVQSTSTGSPAAATGGVHLGFLVYVAPDPVVPSTFYPQVMLY